MILTSINFFLPVYGLKIIPLHDELLKRQEWFYLFRLNSSVWDETGSELLPTKGAVPDDLGRHPGLKQIAIHVFKSAGI